MKDIYHVATGAAIGCAMMSGARLIAPDLSQQAYYAGVAFTVAGAFIPNLDNNVMMNGAQSGLSSFIGQAILQLEMVTGYRKTMHSMWAAIIGALMAWTCTAWTFLPALFGFFLGYTSHLLMDAFTPFGVCLFPHPSWSHMVFLNFGASSFHPVEQINRHYIKLAKVPQTGVSAALVTGVVAAVFSAVPYLICLGISAIF